MLEELGGTHVDGLGQVTPQHMGLYRAEVSGGSLTKASEQRDLAHTELVNRRLCRIQHTDTSWMHSLHHILKGNFEFDSWAS